MKDLSKHYEQWTADERFRLFVEAMGRKDERELDRLEATCPRRRYDAQEYEYTRKKMLFTVLALASVVQKLRIELLASTALVAAFAIDAEAHGESAQTAIDAFRHFMCDRRGKRDGWLRFCDKIGVNPDAITAPFLADIEWAMAPAESVSEMLEQDGAGDPSAANATAAQEFEALIDAWKDTY
jgi:hypothetical protein